MNSPQKTIPSQGAFPCPLSAALGHSFRIVTFLFLAVCSAFTAAAVDKKIILIAGAPTHGSGFHEFRAGCLLLQARLNKVPGVTAIVVSNGWPQDIKVFDGADAIFVYADGAEGHPFIQPGRTPIIAALMKKGVGLGAAHFGVELPKDKGGPEFLEWIGGYFETYWSVNPTWTASFTNFPAHPVTRGVKPFSTRDEWYYHMRFAEGMKNVTPLLTATPPDSTRGKDGVNEARSGNPDVQKHKGEPEHMMWVIERPDGGRGFGFTGGHFHKNWENDEQRKLLLNALLWIAKMEVPADGVQSTISAEELLQNLDDKGQNKPK